MCGRFTFHATPAALARYFALAEAPDLEPRYNIAPSQQVPVVRASERGAWRLGSLRWGLVPFWAKDRTIGHRLINARAETLAEKASFKHAFRRRRCLILASGFYEWRRGPEGKIPVYVTDPAGRPYAFAGLWERWRDRDQLPLDTCVIVTVAANATLASIHDRMPALLDTDGQTLWLDRGAPLSACQALLLPAPDAITEHWPVSRQVNDPAHEGEHLIKPVAPA